MLLLCPRTRQKAKSIGQPWNMLPALPSFSSIPWDDSRSDSGKNKSNWKNIPRILPRFNPIKLTELLMITKISDLLIISIIRFKPLGKNFLYVISE
jgi:hypothetical protein